MTVLVVIAGPQASGKSTLASALGGALRERGERVAVVELDAVAAMALPTLPGWDVAHEVFEVVVARWVRADLTVVVAEGSGSCGEVERVLRQAPAGATTLTVGVTTGLQTAVDRAQTDPTRGISKDPGFLRGVYAQWQEELDQLAPDVLVDTTHVDVDHCVPALVEEVTRRLTAPVAPPESGGTPGAVRAS